MRIVNGVSSRQKLDALKIISQQLIERGIWLDFRQNYL